MSISIANTSTVTRTNTDVTISETHDPNTTGIKGVIAIVLNNASDYDALNSITYGGVNLHRVVQAPDSAGEPGRSQIWYLGNNVPQGAQTVTYTLNSGTADDYHFTCMTVTGNGNVAFVSSNSTSGDQANPSLTSVSNGRECLHIAALFSGLAAPPTVSGTTISSIDFGQQAGIAHRVTALGNTTDEVLSVTSSSDDVAYVSAAFTDAELLQTNWRFRYDNSDEKFASFYGSNNSNAEFNAVSTDKIIRVRFGLQCPGSYPNAKPEIYYTASQPHFDIGFQITDMGDIKRKDITAQLGGTNGPGDLLWKPDGTKLYVCQPSQSRVWQYSLSTAFDVSTMTYDNKNRSFASAGQFTRSVYFKDDGLYFFVCGSSDEVNRWSLSTAWDITTATFDSGQTYTPAEISGAGFPRGLFFKPDGTKMYLGDSSSGLYYQYSLSTPWDLTTVSYDSVSIDIDTFASGSRGVGDGFWHEDGKILLLLGSSTDELRIYDLTTAWDLTTASFRAGGVVDASVYCDNKSAAAFSFSANGKYFVATDGDNANNQVYGHTSNTSKYWKAVTSTSPLANTADSTYLTNGDDTTQQITSGTFITPNDGISEDGIAGDDNNMDFTPGSVTEVEYVINLVSNDLVEGDQVWFRIENADARDSQGFAALTVTTSAPNDPAVAGTASFLLFF